MLYRVQASAKRIEHIRHEGLICSMNRDEVCCALRGMTPADIDAFVEQEINTMADVKRILKWLIKLELVQ